MTKDRQFLPVGWIIARKPEPGVSLKFYWTGVDTFFRAVFFRRKSDAEKVAVGTLRTLSTEVVAAVAPSDVVLM
jgi:hypothetical protein